MVIPETKEHLRFTPNTLLIGASGFIGSELTRIAKEQKGTVLTPSINEFDILEPKKLDAYFSSHDVTVCVNLAAHTDLEEGELERGDKKGSVWKINVNGVSNLLDAAQKHDLFLIHISTDAVFPGTDDLPGPYAEESEPPDNLGPLSWYGYTKLKGEELVRKASGGAVVRIAYPFGNPESQRDFVVRTLSYIKKGYSLFNDQYFTTTYIRNLYDLLSVLSETKNEGVYHAASRGLTTPYDFAIGLAEKLNISTDIKASSVKEYLQKPNAVPRLVKGGLFVELTQNKLDIVFPTWQEALHDYIGENKTEFIKIMQG